VKRFSTRRCFFPGAALLVSLILCLLSVPVQGQLTLDARPIDTGLRAAVGDVAVANLDCDASPPPSSNTCLRVLCDPCPSTIPDLDEVFLNSSLTAGDLQGVLGTSDCVIRDVNTAIELDHSFVGDLIIDFERPGSAASLLYFPPGSCTATRVDAIFDDESSRPPDACTSTGGLSHRPSTSLTPFDGLSAVGAYRFQVADVLPGDSGMVNRWGYALTMDCAQTPPPSDCVENDTTLCLNNDRFQVTVGWATNQGTSGQGQKVELTPDTGYFWFFNQENVEMVIKVLDACSFADRFWVFAGGLTNVEVDITVVDTERNVTRMYTNPQLTPFQPIQDTNAFATCP